MVAHSRDKVAFAVEPCSRLHSSITCDLDGVMLCNFVMDDIEFGARRTMQWPYETLLQQDHNPRSPPVYDNELQAEGPERVSQMRTSNSMSKSLLAQVDSLDPGSKLSPKSFSQASTPKRIWIHIATVTSALTMIAIPVGVFVSILIAGSNDPFDGPGSTLCTASYLYMSSTDFYSAFIVDTPFGTLSFGTAKFIDLVWDIGVSRCGQAMLGWITYRVNTSALLRIMETHPVSYELFSTLSLSWSSVASLGPIMKAFFTRLGFRKKLILMWIVLNIFWVAFWPTITNAMTGYIAKYNALVKLQGEDGYANFTDIDLVSNLGFQLYTKTSINSTWSSAPIGPILLSTGPNTTLWDNLSQCENLFSRLVLTN
jgi:hypothetical protein